MSKGFITGINEELIKAYKESRDESYLKDLIEANKGLINLLVSPYLTSIPNSELEDLTSESYIPMLRAIEDYDPEQGVAFSTLLKVYVRQHLNRLYNEATRQKRFTGKDVVYDATNLKASYRVEFLDTLRLLNCKKVCVFVDTPFEVCVKRNEERERTVPKEAMDRMKRFLEPPTFAEGWDEIRVVKNWDEKENSDGGDR